MAKKKFPQITRHGEILWAPHENQYASELLRSQGLHPIPTATARRWGHEVGLPPVRRTPWPLFAPLRNGENEPLTILCVVDALLRARTDGYIHAGALSKALNDRYGQLVVFEPYTVGRVLRGLYEAQPSRAPDEGMKPLELAQWGGIKMYAIIESQANWIWLANARESASQQVRAFQEAAIEVGWPRTEFIWQAFENLSDQELLK